MMNLDLLFDLLRCHSTPGDEDEVAQLLLNTWKNAGWQTTSHGRYAISAAKGKNNPELPTVLVCAHMDSPGFSVDVLGKKQARLTTLGGVRFENETTPAVVKTRDRKQEVLLEKKDDEVYCPLVSGLRTGDRLCFPADPGCDDQGLIHSPFLDNRSGCWLLTQLAQDSRCQSADGINLVLGATSCEEMGGFGAPVLAREIQPDAVICLDATYEAEEQNVRLHHGPALTLSDNSVILGPTMQNQIEAFFAAYDLPLQTEVYNYSGTDSRAFPQAGLKAPVYALLLPTRGNHSPCETASVQDLESWLEAVVTMLVHGKNANLWNPGFDHG